MDPNGFDTYNEYYIDLIIKCHDDDQNAIKEYYSTSWNTLTKKITFDEDFIKCITKLSDDGNSYGQNVLGLIYEYCDEVKQDYSKAIELFRKAISKNNYCSMYNLACMIGRGDGIEKNPKEAAKLFEILIEQNISCAIVDIANMYRDGEGYEQNLPKAKKLYEKAIKQKGSTRAMNNMASIFFHSRYGEKNYYKAGQLYKKSGNSGKLIKCINHLINGKNLDILQFRNLLKDIPDEILTDITLHASITLKLMKCEQTIASKEVIKTILIIKGIPMEIIDSEIIPKI